MGIIPSIFGSLIGRILPDRPYWAVKLTSGKMLTELDTQFDHLHGYARPFDWTLDLVSTGDILKVTELWLFCPSNVLNPRGQIARLPIPEPGTAFQFKVGMMDAFGEPGRGMIAQCIGRVDDKETGVCTCFVWDTQLGALGTWSSNIYAMGSWREDIGAIGAVSHDVLGLTLS
jgi:hypothetical protein